MKALLKNCVFSDLLMPINVNEFYTAPYKFESKKENGQNLRDSLVFHSVRQE